MGINTYRPCRPYRGRELRSRRLGFIGHQRLGGQHHAGDAGGVLQSGAGHLGGIHDAAGDHVAVLLLVGVKAVAILAGGTDLLQDHGAIQACIGCDLADRLLQSFGHNLHAGLLVALHLIQQGSDGGNGVYIDGAAAGHDALFHGGLGGIQSVLNAELLLPSSLSR